MPIDKPYAYHLPSENGKHRVDTLREHFTDTDRLIREICGNNREASLAITKLEECAMWAIKAVVFNDPKSEVEE